MPQPLEQIPLFPMNLVLFPYATLQVHVGDERHRELVRECVKLDQAFGIVLQKPGSDRGPAADTYLVGTAVRVFSVHSYYDGQMDVSVKGERRFRIRKVDDSGRYLVGHVEPVVEMEIEDSPRAHALTQKAREFTEAFIAAHFSHSEYKVAMVRLPQDVTALSFLVANLLPVENLAKQRLLETTDTLERLAELIPVLERAILESATPRYVRLTAQAMSAWIHPN